jgi:hypothetical protein
MSSWRFRRQPVLPVARLCEAAARGLVSVWWHLEIDLEPLWDYPPFLELIRPKG